MKIKKGSLEYHISYGIHSNIPECCIFMWLTENHADWQRRFVLRDKAFKNCQYVPCLDCIKNLKCNKIVHCERHKKPCCFIPKGRNWLKGPPEVITITRDLERKMAKFRAKYDIP